MKAKEFVLSHYPDAWAKKVNGEFRIMFDKHPETECYISSEKTEFKAWKKAEKVLKQK